MNADAVERTGRLHPGDPREIAGHTLLGRIGEGGMGTVYLARSHDGRRVAIKLIKAAHAMDAGFAARFRDEVASARRVASFCTARVLGDGVADGRPYMITEYIPGVSLARQVSDFGALEPGTLHGVALGVAAALTAIHAAGLVHRDLKPANVILSMSGPRVIDFGIARALDSSHALTRAGQLVGSPGWWAPEQVRGLPVTPAVDVFTWGCLVAYAGTGRHPYGEGDALTMAARLLHATPDPGRLPAPLDGLVARALDPDPARRPSAGELLLALAATAEAPAAPPSEGPVARPAGNPDPGTGSPTGTGSPAGADARTGTGTGPPASPAGAEARAEAAPTGGWRPPGDPAVRPEAGDRRWRYVLPLAVLLILGAAALGLLVIPALLAR
ncbi:serine/threonine-protein kinase [Bailinhaonella thermotolerans]|uniref:Serine/threonine protein kinase n=1 Tax=Bailinhaonella thermotolerans TaxID=1070861 RepID=A0A3A4B5C6_9ACTN|nr:serine/threonine-protein kinase [Bailinhaonella thermotolerans]RJL33271.1 serine/threonine protein kinase [Bailinhaonella thermotolerans]